MIENYKEGKQLIIVFCPRELQGGYYGKKTYRTIKNLWLSSENRAGGLIEDTR